MQIGRTTKILRYIGSGVSLPGILVIVLSLLISSAVVVADDDDIDTPEEVYDAAGADDWIGDYTNVDIATNLDLDSLGDQLGDLPDEQDVIDFILSWLNFGTEYQPAEVEGAGSVLEQDPSKWIARVKERMKSLKNSYKVGERLPIVFGASDGERYLSELEDLFEMDRYSRVPLYFLGQPIPKHVDDAEVSHTYMPPYTLNTSDSCMQPRPLPGVFCAGWVDGSIYFRPLITYYVPFQQVETHESPFVTGYGQEDRLKEGEIDKQTWDIIKTSALMYVEKDTKLSVEQGGAFDVAKDGVKADEKALEAGEHLSIFQRMQNATLPGSGYRYAEYNLIPTWYHEYYKFDPRFTGGGSGIKAAPVPWCHAGAVYSWIPFKPEIPMLFSWEPYIALYSRWATLSMDDPHLQEITPVNGEDMHCMTLKNIIEGDWTAEELQETATWVNGSEDLGEKCLPKGFQDTLGPIITMVKNLSPAKAAETVAARALSGIDVWNSLIPFLWYTQENGQKPTRNFHPFARYANIFKRDKQQILRNPGAPKGCGEFNNQEEWMTDWSGEVYDEMNDEEKKAKGHWNTFAQWRYIQCCPVGTFPLPPVPMQFY